MIVIDWPNGGGEGAGSEASPVVTALGEGGTGVVATAESPGGGSSARLDAAEQVRMATAKTTARKGMRDITPVIICQAVTERNRSPRAPLS